ncbi:MAG TPA: HupE/UreJ family protein [Povalibacter sp.]
MTSVFARRCLAAVSMIIAPALALAHPEGHSASDALAGLLHPFTGLDHLLAMFAVGLWAARSGRGAVWTLPVVFPVVMVAGAVLAMRGVTLPAIEPMIAISVISLGVLIALGARLPLATSALLVGVFAIFHGYAHASEAPGSATMVPYALGFIASTVLLHTFGITTGWWTERRVEGGHRPMRVVGSLIAVAGASMLVL